MTAFTQGSRSFFYDTEQREPYFPESGLSYEKALEISGGSSSVFQGMLITSEDLISTLILPSTATEKDKERIIKRLSRGEWSLVLSDGSMTNGKTRARFA